MMLSTTLFFLSTAFAQTDTVGTMKSPGMEFWKAVRRAYPLPPVTGKIAYIDGKKKSFVKTCDGKYVKVNTAEDAVEAFGKLYNCGGN